VVFDSGFLETATCTYMPGEHFSRFNPVFIRILPKNGNDFRPFPSGLSACGTGLTFDALADVRGDGGRRL